jgi:hypothetical protein
VKADRVTQNGRTGGDADRGVTAERQNAVRSKDDLRTRGTNGNVRCAYDKGVGPKRVGDTHTDVVATNARTYDLPERLIAVLRDIAGPRVDMTDGSRGDERFLWLVMRRGGRTGGDTSHNSHRRCCGHKPPPAIADRT